MFSNRSRHWGHPLEQRASTCWDARSREREKSVFRFCDIGGQKLGVVSKHLNWFPSRCLDHKGNMPQTSCWTTGCTVQDSSTEAVPLPLLPFFYRLVIYLVIHRPSEQPSNLPLVDFWPFALGPRLGSVARTWAASEQRAETGLIRDTIHCYSGTHAIRRQELSQNFI